jgi:plasmid stabilization system protein ParE
MLTKPFHAHIVFYRVGGDVIEIFRVMHGARDLPRRLQQPP